MPEEPNIRHSKPVSVWLKGQPWASWWELTADRKVRVFGAYGERVSFKPLGRRNPEKVAEELLEEIVRNFEFNPVPPIHQKRRRR